MSRRSVRLQSSGYYNPDGTPNVCYKETRVRKWTYRRRYGRKGNNSVSEMDISYCRSSSSNGDMVKYKLKHCFFSILFFALIYGFARILAPLTMEPPVSSPPTINTVSVPGSENEGKQKQEMKDVLVGLQNKMDYLLPSVDLLPNFALKSQGAKVIHWMPSAIHPGQIRRCSGFGIQQPSIHPSIVIQGRTRLHPGECWAFEGSEGHLVIALSHKVVISQVTLGHIPKMLSPTGNIWSAPKEFSVYGMREPEQEWTHLGTFLYENDQNPLQTFALQSHRGAAFRSIKLQISSNWGHRQYTCLYNFRVHGKIAQEDNK
ncbi:SUN domain-containing protein 3-like [Gambusia affinis]|uniref:SUN domain-containing protein 3-like n=1 Tax=Gambusia affinis TaxID=33528 RepID=UPI001CDD8FF4|nr:SUN domain-containing protein 3-like [Gambusia affinis]